MMKQSAVECLLQSKELQLVNAETDYKRTSSTYGTKSIVTIHFKSIRNGIRRECNVLREVLRG